MKNKKLLIAATVLIVMNAFAATAVNLKDIQFKYAEDKSTLELTFDKDAQVTKTVSEADKQVVLEIKDAKISKKLSRKLDTSSFNGNVTLISPYQAENDVRIVLQLKNAGDVDVQTNGSKTVALISNGAASATASADPVAPVADTAKTDPVQPTSEEPKAAEEPKEETPKVADTASESVDALVDALQTKEYKGKKITIQLQNADLQDVFKIISEASDLNIIMADDVKGRVSLNLYDVPWDQVLDIILKSNKLTAEKSGNVLRIATLDAVTKEKEAELLAKKAVESVEPLVVKIFPISYAKIDELRKILSDFLSKESTSGKAGEPASITTRGTIQIDSRTNALVVRDTASSIEKIKRIIKELDTQTPQILIEAKFVEVSEDKSHEVQGRIFATSREFSASSNQLSFNNDRGNFGTTFGGSSLGSTLPTGFSITPVAGATFGFSPKTAGFLPPGFRDLAAFLGILETESNSKIIASPRVIAQNKEPAEISQGKSLQIAVPAGPNVAGGFQTVNATLKLQVTPQVTSEGSINLKLSFSQDSPSNLPTAGATISLDTKKVDTSVLVESGSTLVIGGIYSSNELKAASGIPFLRDLPLIGVFFGDKKSSNLKNELFIFLTPRILNEKESGIRG